MMGIYLTSIMQAVHRQEPAEGRAADRPARRPAFGGLAPLPVGLPDTADKLLDYSLDSCSQSDTLFDLSTGGSQQDSQGIRGQKAILVNLKC